VSPGTASGVVVSSSVDELPDADALILVCESADAEVHPLLPFVSGVVAARGSELSHIAILAREFGIPAVVGYRDAMRLIPGTVISINGTTGEVRVENRR
jgi:pyruvate,water dikinase